MTRRRVAVAALRLRLEDEVVRAFDAVAEPERPDEHYGVQGKITFLHGLGQGDEVIALIRMTRYVYARMSSVLHGRTVAVNVSDVLLAEWEHVVRDLEHFVDSALPAE
ncbi:hypothetical protein JOF53_007240 [Crossiella equi]|uniref:Uncharacterized protein n=1 Tax=Crossiella equi TaxID=130796 RepID=A0ABS5AP74_9PSEU|nr:hypothetical protein [Crossiella equi]MBP2478368.1 hypothetical protein [Crossiella equi]